MENRNPVSKRPTEKKREKRKKSKRPVGEKTRKRPGGGSQ